MSRLADIHHKLLWPAICVEAMNLNDVDGKIKCYHRAISGKL